LIELFTAVLKIADCTILEGHRGEARQNELRATGRSMLAFPHSKHNRTPSAAVDVVPYPLNWGDRDRFHLFAGVVLGVAASMGLAVRWGGDWDRDFRPANNSFDDLPHYELIDDGEP